MLIREGRLFDIMGNYLAGLVLFIVWELFCTAFNRAWSMSLNSELLIFSRKIDNQIQLLGRAFKHNLVPWEGYLNKPVLKSSLAHGLPRGDIKSLN